MVTQGTQSRGMNGESSVYHDTLAYPASHSEVIAIGASNDGNDSNDLFDSENRAYFNQYGDGIANSENEISIFAPGTSNCTTTNSGEYDYLSGTSASTLMVAGVITNTLAVYPTLSLTDIKTYLSNGADQFGPKANQPHDLANEFSYTAGGFSKFDGHGRANVYKSVRLV